MKLHRSGPGVVWVTEPPWCVPIATAELAARLGVTVRTVHRWCAGAPIPRTAELAIRSAILGAFEHPRWRGWRITPDGRLWAPSGPGARQGFQPGELEAWSYVYQTNELLWRVLRPTGAASAAGDETLPARSP